MKERDSFWCCYCGRDVLFAEGCPHDVEVLKEVAIAFFETIGPSEGRWWARKALQARFRHSVREEFILLLEWRALWVLEFGLPTEQETR